MKRNIARRHAGRSHAGTALMSPKGPHGGRMPTRHLSRRLVANQYGRGVRQRCERQAGLARPGGHGDPGRHGSRSGSLAPGGDTPGRKAASLRSRRAWCSTGRMARPPRHGSIGPSASMDDEKFVHGSVPRRCDAGGRAGIPGLAHDAPFRACAWCRLFRRRAWRSQKPARTVLVTMKEGEGRCCSFRPPRIKRGE